MYSINEVKRGWKKGLAAILIAAASSAVPANADMVAGGSVPIVNYAECIPNTAIAVGDAAAAFTTVARVIVSNNTPGGFTLGFTMVYGGFNRVGVVVAPPVAPAGNPFLTAQVIAGAVQPANSLLSGIAFVTLAWTPGAAAATTTDYAAGAQTVATLNYAVDLQATWAAGPTMLAGYYEEHFIVRMVAIL
jgi:hypothetical protein